MVIDQSSAFDCIEHQLLLQKLKFYSIDWIASYLAHRTQYVSIGKHCSRMVPINSGVPQGSVLGPLLFLIYTNEFPEAVRDKSCEDPYHRHNVTLFGANCKLCGGLPVYADDATYVISSRSRQYIQVMIKDRLIRIKDRLIRIKDFLSSNMFAINEMKTSITEYKLKQKRAKPTGVPPSLVVQKTNGEWKTIVDSKNCRLLGATLQNNVS